LSKTSNLTSGAIGNNSCFDSITLQEVNKEDFVVKLDNYLNKVVQEKYQKAAELYIVKDNSVAQGREFVKAYVDYMPVTAAFNNIIMHGVEHN
jgi:hypothetical protein